MGWTDYREQSTLWLDMKMRDHDATNVRTLDRSGNGHHVQFGNGITSTTYPTKLSKRGYNFDGGDYLDISDYNSELPSGASERTFVFVAKLDTLGARQEFVSYGTNAAGQQFNIEYNSGNDSIQLAANNHNWGVGTISSKISTGQYFTLFAVVPSGATQTDDVQFYLNGERQVEQTFAGFPRTLNTVVGGYTSAFGGIAFYLQGDLLSTILFNIALSTLQIEDLHFRLMREINEV